MSRRPTPCARCTHPLGAYAFTFHQPDRTTRYCGQCLRYMFLHPGETSPLSVLHDPLAPPLTREPGDDADAQSSREP